MACKPTYKGVRYNSLEELYNANGVNEQQKQKAQQIYSEYLSQNPNGSVEGFKSWVDNNQSNVQYQKQVDLQAEQDSVLEEFANSLSEKFNISFDLISEEEAESISLEYANEPAFFDPKTKKAYLVKGKANKTSAIHEIFTHPFLLQIEKTNPTLYKNLLKEAKNNKSVVDYVDNLYGTNQNNDHEYIARAIDLAVQGELNQQKDKTLLERIQDFFNQLYDYLKKLFNIPEVFSSAISPNITLQQLAQFAMYGKGKMNLNPAQENIEYSLKATSVIVKNLDKIKQWEKNKSISEDVLWKKIQELQVPKEQIELIKNSEGNTVEEKLLDFTNQYSYTVEINTAKEELPHYEMVDETGEGDFQPQEFIPDTELITIEDDEGNVIGVEEVLSERGKKQIEERENKRKPTQYYSYLTVNEEFYENNPDWEYREQRITTPLIIPSIEGHAQFAQGNDIGWFRAWYNKKTGEVHVLEVQSDLFQKGRDREMLVDTNAVTDFDQIGYYYNGDYYESDGGKYFLKNGKNISFDEFEKAGEAYDKQKSKDSNNQFLQLLNKNNNWVTFFVKSIIQDSAKKGYDKVLFPTSEVVSQIQKFDEVAEKYSNAISKLEKDRTSEDNFIISEWEKDSTKRTIKGTLDFYNNLRNTLDNLVGGNKNDRKKGIYKLQQITDEYGNKWNEVTIDENRDNQNIVFQKTSQERLNQVQKLFESNPELANEVYEALGFGKESNLSEKNIFTVEPIQNVDKKAKSKAKIATQYIGFAEGIAGSSTALYAKQAGKYANTGNYSSSDVIFVSIGGRRGNEATRKTQQDRTIREAIKALDAGATLITDNAAYVESNSYNEGEKRLAANLKAKGYVYSETTVDGNVLGVWNKVNTKTTPEQKQQAQQLYSQYLDTIFPDSKVKDIVYHGTTDDKFYVYDSNEGEYIFKLDKLNKNTHFGTLQAVKDRIKTKRFNADSIVVERANDLIIPVIINSFPKSVQDQEDSNISWSEEIDVAKNEGYNSLSYFNIKEDKGSTSYVVFKPEQIHILGSKQDVEGFREFVSDKNNASKENNTIVGKVDIDYTIPIFENPNEFSDEFMNHC